MSLQGELDKFGQLFKQHLSGTMKATIRWVTADKVDWENQTMDASDGEGLEFFDVLLGIDSAVVKPVVGTDCLIAIVENDEATAFMLFANEVELIQYNGGENGGLTIGKQIVANLESIKDYVEAIHSALPNAFNAIGAGTAANGAMGKQAYESAMAGKKIELEEIENDKITH